MATKPKQLSITPERFQHIAEIAKKYGLKLVVLFGSHVTGKLHTESDVDIAVLPERPLSFQNEMRLRADLVAVFDRVDVTNLGTAAKQPLLMFCETSKDRSDLCSELSKELNSSVSWG